MASSLRLITSSLAVPFRSTVVSASRFFSHNASRQSYTTGIDDFFDQSWLRTQMSLWPNIHSVSFHMVKTAEGRSLTLNMPGLEKMETGDCLCVSLNMPGLKKDDIKACVEHNTLFIQGKAHNECYLASIKLLDQTSSDVKEEIEDGILKITFPEKEKFKTNIIATDKPHWPYSDMFSDLSILGKGFCPVIALMSKINSFSMFKEETDESLHINMCMPGHEKMELTTKGVRVSLSMPGLKIEDVKAFFYYDTFFIEGKTKNKHYITGVHLPEGIHKEHNMINKQMRNGMFHATLPYVET